MMKRILTVVAVAAALAACETAPQDTGATAGAGQGAIAAPAGVQPGSQADLVANVGDRVFFDFDKYSLRSDARATLDKQAAWLQQYPNAAVVVEGHADERGTREYNLALGERRASSVKNYLVSQGVAANRIKTISYGKERPVSVGSNEAAWSQNRRGVTAVQ